MTLTHSVRCIVCVISCSSSAGFAAAQSADAPLAGQASETAAAQTEATQFPGSVGQVVRQYDGSAVCIAFPNTGPKIYLSGDDPRRWVELPVQPSLPKGCMVTSALGGDRDRQYFAAQFLDGHGTWLAAYDVATKQGTILRQFGYLSRLAAFASKDVGAIGTGRNVNLTADGGRTWNPTPPLVDAKFHTVCSVLWISTTRVLVGATDGSMQLLEREGSAKLKVIWATAPDKSLEQVRQFTRDGNHAWSLVPLRRLRLSDGHVDAPIAAGFKVDVILRLQDHLVLAGWKGVDGQQFFFPPPVPVLAEWKSEAEKGYVPGPSPAVPQGVAGILPVEPGQTTCLVIGYDAVGRVFNPETAKLEPVPLHVVSLPIPVNPDVPSEEERKALMDLGEKVPPEQLVELIHEADKKNFTKKQWTDWLIAQFQLVIARNKNAAPASPPPPQ